MKKKTKSTPGIFDYLKFITVDKKPWNELDDDSKKDFQPYMINRWLSMHPDLIDIVNYLQPFTVGVMDKEMVYKMYLELLPKKSFFLKYIKADKEEKYPSAVVDIFRTHFGIDKQRASEYIDIVINRDPQEIHRYLEKYGLQDKDKKKIIKQLNI